ncbi:MAG: hypothetical protein Q8L65_15035, partial [Burkholderiales bacterium]|nr:hypothetical protein [Burkholderiales bacterium]
GASCGGLNGQEAARKRNAAQGQRASKWWGGDYRKTHGSLCFNYIFSILSLSVAPRVAPNHAAASQLRSFELTIFCCI